MLIEKGDSAIENNEMEEAIYYYSLAKESCERKNINDEELLMGLNGLCLCYNQLGDFQKSFEYGIEVVEKSRMLYGEEHPKYAYALDNLAQYYYNIGDDYQAIAYETKAMSILQEATGKDNIDYATFLVNMSCMLSHIKECDKGIRCAKQAVKIYRKIFGEKHDYIANALLCISQNYWGLKDYTRAVKYCTKGIKIIELLHREDSPDYAWSLNSLARFLSDSGKNDKAVKYGRKAVGIYKTLFGDKTSDYALLLGNLATYYCYLGDFPLAENYIKKSLQIERENAIMLFCYLPLKQRYQYWGWHSIGFDSIYPWIKYESGSVDASDLYNLSALFAKGILFTTEKKLYELIKDKCDENLLQLLEKLQMSKKTLQHLYETPVDKRKIDSDSLAQQIEVLERRILEEVKSYSDFSQSMCATWRDVQNSLAPNEIAIEFLSFEIPKTDITMIAALTLRKNDDMPKFIPLINTKQLNLSIGQDYLSSDLSKRIWEPLKNELTGISRIYFSPANILCAIGIEYTKEMDIYDMVRVSTTANITELKNDINRDKINGHNALLIGGVNYNEDTPDSNIKEKYCSRNITGYVDSIMIWRESMAYLPGTLAEIENIQLLLQNNSYTVTTLSDSMATESQVKAISGNSPNIIHIATHGFCYRESYAPPKKGKDLLFNNETHNQTFEDFAMAHSGLILARTNNVIKEDNNDFFEDDGILTAYEISQLDLCGTDLVVLSACDTGRGDIVFGEGVYGIQRAFKKAGAKTVLVSLWKVEDTPTEILMTNFYKNLCKGKNKRESLRMAQKEVREYTDSEGTPLFQDPYYWAGFIMLD